MAEEKSYGEMEVIGNKGIAEKMPILSWSVGQTRNVSDKKESGKEKLRRQVFVTRYMDKYSDQIRQYVLSTEPLKVAIHLITERDKAVIRRMVISLSDAFFSNLSYHGSGGDGKPAESVTVDFEELTMNP